MGAPPLRHTQDAEVGHLVDRFVGAAEREGKEDAATRGRERSAHLAARAALCVMRPDWLVREDVSSDYCRGLEGRGLHRKAERSATTPVPGVSPHGVWWISPPLGRLRDIFADMLCQDFVDQCLVAYPSSACFLAELIEHARINPDRDQLPRFITEWRTAHAPHRFQLRGRRIGNVRKVNLSRCRPGAPGDSRAAR